MCFLDVDRFGSYSGIHPPELHCDRRELFRVATVFQCRVTKQPNFDADLKHDLYNMVHSRLDRMLKIRYPVGFAAQVFAVPSRFGEAFQCL